MDASRDAGSIPAASTRANLRDIASWPFSLAYGKSLAFLSFTASNQVQTEVQLGGSQGPIRLRWIASEVAISQTNRKITRRHDRRKSGRSDDAKGERFSLQGRRWRFPRGLSSMEVDTRISRLRELWSDHERFCESQLLVDLTANSQMSRSLLVKRCGLLEGRAVGEKRESLAEKGIFPNTEEASWTSLSLWIAEQIKLGVQPVPLPPLLHHCTTRLSDVLNRCKTVFVLR